MPHSDRPNGRVPKGGNDLTKAELAKRDNSEDFVAHSQGWEEAYLSAFPVGFQERIKSDPEFAERALLAKDILTDMIQMEAIRRALAPSRRPIYQRGEFMGWEDMRPDNKHIQWVLERLAPEQWNLKTKVELSASKGGGFSFQFNMGENEIEASEAEFDELPEGD